MDHPRHELRSRALRALVNILYTRTDSLVLARPPGCTWLRPHYSLMTPALSCLLSSGHDCGTRLTLSPVDTVDHTILLHRLQSVIGQ
uniref:Uncharacterized protein n=1 Tax=Knipowitschia caucasica TaxID=637954 RepID=A0AAV2M941_KNICA